MPRTYFSEEVKRTAIDLVLQSRLTVGVAAQQVGCSVNALHHWLKKHRQEQCPGTPPTFVPITLVDSAPTSIEIDNPPPHAQILIQRLRREQWGKHGESKNAEADGSRRKRCCSTSAAVYFPVGTKQQ